MKNQPENPNAPAPALYYHVQRSGVSGFRPGRSHEFGSGQNFFARDLFGVEVLVPVAGTGGLPVDHLLRDYLDPTGMGHYRQMRSKTLTPTKKGCSCPPSRSSTTRRRSCAS